MPADFTDITEGTGIIQPALYRDQYGGAKNVFEARTTSAARLSTVLLYCLVPFFMFSFA